MPEVQYSQPKRIHGDENFIIELVVQGKSVRIPCKCYDRESAAHTALVMVATNYPAVQGYNLLTADGETLLEEVHPTQLFIHAAPIIQQITGQQPMRMAVPIVDSKNAETEFGKMLADAQKRGKVLMDPSAQNTPPGTPGT